MIVVQLYYFTIITSSTIALPPTIAQKSIKSSETLCFIYLFLYCYYFGVFVLITRKKLSAYTKVGDYVICWK